MGKMLIRPVALSLVVAAAAAAVLLLLALRSFEGGEPRASAVVLTQQSPDSLCIPRLDENAAGQDSFGSEAQVIVDTGAGPVPFQVIGPTMIRRGAPGDSNSNGLMDIQTEIVAMTLTGTDPVLGPVTINESPMLASMGMVESQAGNPAGFLADSFFDVFVEVTIGPPPGSPPGTPPTVEGKNTQPAHMTAVINCIPPLGTSYQSTNQVEIVDRNRGTHIGTMTDARHTPEPPRSIDVIKLDEPNKQPRPGAVVTLHPGVGCKEPPIGAGATGLDGQFTFRPLVAGQYSVKEQIPPHGLQADPSGPCTDVDHRGDYPIASQPQPLSPGLPAGRDFFPSCGLVVIDFGGQLETTELEGLPTNPTTIQRQDPVGGTIATEMLSLDLSGNSPTLGGVTVRKAPTPPSTGQINTSTGDTFFDVFFEVQAQNLPVTLHNQQALQIQATINQVPPSNTYFRSRAPVQLLDPQSQPVGSLELAIHKPKPAGEKCVILRNPPGPPERIVFSIERGGPTAHPSVGATRHPADILTLVGTPPPVFRTCISLGLTAAGCGTTASLDDIRALSDGLDFSAGDPDLPKKVFSVDTGSLGAAGTHVNTEATCNPSGAEPNADDYLTNLDTTNTIEFDGNGAPGCLSAFSKGLVEPMGPPAGDDQDALSQVHATDPWYFTLAPASPSLTGLPIGPVTTAHILKSVGGVVSVYATPAQLGLTIDDKIDGLCLRDKDGIFDANPLDGLFDDPPDRLHFSLDANSPTLAAAFSPPLSPAASKADQFKPKTSTSGGLPVRVNTAAEHGLLVDDNLDAMKCLRADQDNNGIPDPIDTGAGKFSDGTTSGMVSGPVALADEAVGVSGEASGDGGSLSACTSPSASLALSFFDVFSVACGSVTITATVGPIPVTFGPFTAIVPTGSTVIIDLLAASAPPCTPPGAAAGAYQINHSAGTVNVTVSSANMLPPVTMPPGTIRRDCDADGVFGEPGPDNCPRVANSDQANFDHDALGDACDLDDDNDKVYDADEGPCGADPLNAALRPERLDTPGDDDGDTIPNEALPGGSSPFDCDGDGWKGNQENLIYNVAPSTANDQDPCGNTGWPAELADNNNRLDIGDLGSFLFPARLSDDGHGTFDKFNHPLDDSPPAGIDPAMARWNLDIAGGPPPGGGHEPTTVINIGDLGALNPAVLATTARPPMFGGQPAFFTNGGQCPYPP